VNDRACDRDPSAHHDPAETRRSAPTACLRRAHRFTALPLLTLVLTILLAALSHGAAQQRFNFLAVEDQVLDDAGPYYFVNYGDSTNAYAKAGPFAAAMNLEVDYDGERGLLVFTRGTTTAEWRVTRDVPDGLQHREGVLTIDGAPFPRPIPSALLIDGTSYVAITPLAEAFGGDAAWLPSARVIRITLPDPEPVVATPTTPPSSSPNASSNPAADPTSRTTPGNAATARIGQHDAYTRVALDAPSEQPARLLATTESVALVLQGLPLAPLDRSFDDGALARVYTDTLGGDPALVLVTRHAIDPNGRGYRLGRTAAGAIYLDVGPDLQGEPAAGTAPEPSAAPVAAAAAPPAPRRQVVVIDAGHGGHDPGTVSDWAQEKEIVLDVALRVAARLRAAGIEVILTRDDDTFLTLQERSTFATTERNVFVSIHANAAPNRSASGIETWVFGQPLDPSLIDRAIRENGGGDVGAALTAEAAEVADIAGDILRETQLNYSLNLANLVQDAMVGATGATDRGVRQNLFYVIRNSRIPAVLLELGFVSHAEEGRRLMRDDYRATLADAISDGLLAFLDAGGEDPDLASR